MLTRQASNVLFTALAIVLYAGTAPAAAQIVFEPPVGSNGGHDSMRILLGDVVEDGRADAIITHFVFSGPPDLRPGLGDGTFGEPTSLFGQSPRALVHFNADDHLDLLGAGGPGTPVVAEVRLGDGAGNFGPAALISDAGGIPITACAGDFDGDGLADVAAVDAFLFSGSHVVVALGNGDGTFAASQVVASLPLFVSPTFLYAGDTNGDGLDDIVLGNITNPVLLSLGDGAFAPAPCSSCLPLTDLDIVLADLNGDGRADVLSPTRVLLADPDGNFTTSTPHDFSGSSIAAADFDDDGVLDAALGVATGGGDGHVLIQRGHGDGTFASPGVTLSHVLGVFALAAGDLDGEGRTDLAAVRFDIVLPTLFGLLNHTYAPGSPFLDLGFALAGSHGAPIQLDDGSLIANDPYSFRLANGPPNGGASLFLGFDALNAPFKGGTMVPLPQFKVGPLPLDATGGITLTGLWPAGGSGAVLYLQWWMAQAGGPANFAASSAVRVQVP